VSITGAGTCTVGAAQAASSDGAYAAGSASVDVPIDRAPQALSFINAPPATPTYGGTWAPSLSSGGSTAAAVLGVAPNSTGCVLDGGIVRFSGVGACTVTLDQAGDANHLAASQVSKQFTVSPASTTVTPTMPLSLTVGTALVPSATLDSPTSACRSGQTVAFALDKNPVTGVTGSYALGSGTTDATGAAKAPTVRTTGWGPDAYLLTDTFAGTANCAASSGAAPLSITSAGQVAVGAGTYTISGRGPVAFAFALTRLPRTGRATYAGAIAVVQAGKWSYLGSITSFVKNSATSGTISGKGSLSWWNPALNRNRGGWNVARTGVPFSARFSSTTTTSRGFFGVQLSYTPVPPQPAVLPNSDPVALSRGAIALQ
jgi:hypothetical protein